MVPYLEHHNHDKNCHATGDQLRKKVRSSFEHHVEFVEQKNLQQTQCIS